MGLPRFTPLVACLALGLCSATQASAQSVGAPTKVDRDRKEREGTAYAWWISYDDCKANDVLYLTVPLSGDFKGKSLQVWVGSNCSDPAARTGSGGCWKVYEKSAQSTPHEVAIRAQDIVAQRYPNDPNGSGPDIGKPADCEKDTGDKGTEITLNFMLVDGAGTLMGTPSAWSTTYDLVGPAAPSGVSAGIGEDRLIVDWEASASSDVIEYYVYCDPKPGSVSPANHPMAVDGAAGSTGTDGAAGSTSAGGAAGTAGAGGAAGVDGSAPDVTSSGGTAGADAAGDAGDEGSDGAAGSGGNPLCPSAALTPDVRPADDSYKCGHKTTSGGGPTEAEGLQNGVRYAVAVAALDAVGNRGPLSQVACGTPQPVDDFFELYRRAGGRGGGGFCSLGSDPRPGALVLLGAGLGALLVRRRRRSR